jgi:outer membrane protein
LASWRNKPKCSNSLPVLGKAAFSQFSDNKGQSFGAQISIPVFNGFSVRNNVESGKLGDLKLH